MNHRKDPKRGLSDPGFSVGGPGFLPLHGNFLLLDPNLNVILFKQKQKKFGEKGKQVPRERTTIQQEDLSVLLFGGG